MEWKQKPESKINDTLQKEIFALAFILWSKNKILRKKFMDFDVAVLPFGIVYRVSINGTTSANTLYIYICSTQVIRILLVSRYIGIVRLNINLTNFFCSHQ